VRQLTRTLYHLKCAFVENLNGFERWISEQGMVDAAGRQQQLYVAAFKDGFELSDGFHTLTTNPHSSDTKLYNAFVYGHGPTGTHTAYGYLAGYDCELISVFNHGVLYNSNCYYIGLHGLAVVGGPAGPAMAEPLSAAL